MQGIFGCNLQSFSFTVRQQEQEKQSMKQQFQSRNLFSETVKIFAFYYVGGNETLGRSLSQKDR